MAEEERTYRYDAAGIDPALVRELGGLAILQRMRDGALPVSAMHATMALRVTEVDAGRVVFEGRPERFAYNPHGVVHGGWASTLLDSAMGCAVWSVLPKGVGYTTVELSVRLVRPIRAGDVVTCEARVVHAGRRLATAEGTVRDAAGRTLAHGSTSCLVFQPEP